MNTLPLFPQDDNPILKKCSKCKDFFPATLEFFYSNKNKKDGFGSDCKTCDSARRKAYTETHREQERANRKLYRDNHLEEERARRKAYIEANKEHVERKKKEWWQSERGKQTSRLYRQRNKAALNEYSSQYYQENADNLRERQRQYLQTEKGRMVDKAHKQKRKAQKRAVEGSYTAAQLQDQLKRQKNKCYWCHEKLGKGKGAWHADHILPLARGGSNSIDNIVCACPTCNMRRKDKLPHEWSDGGRLL